MTTILGVDPGLAIVGFGLLKAEPSGDLPTIQGWGVIRTEKGLSDSERLEEIHRDLTALVEQAKPDVAVVEKLFFFRNITTAISVAQARGVILQVLAHYGIPLVEYTPLQVKQTLTGYGKAKKQEIQEALCLRFGLEEPPRPDDAADGVALALMHWQQTRYVDLAKTPLGGS